MPGSACAAQAGAHYRFDWGLPGLCALAPEAVVVIVVDVLSFTTAVDVAVARGAAVLPHPGGALAEEYASRHQALLASSRRSGEAGRPWSLSPASLGSLAAGDRLVLPSPNGSAVAAAAAQLGPTVLAASLRNASACAAAARSLAGADGVIAVVGAGERWADGSLRPAVEDLLGAGAVLAALDPSAAVSAPACSPEAAAARAAFVAAQPRLVAVVEATVSARELAAQGWEGDVAPASEHDVSQVVPVLEGVAFVAL